MKILSLLLLLPVTAAAQNFTKQDTLKGSDTRYRDFWDVKKYELSVEPDFASRTVRGANKITFTITKDVVNPVFQIDLQQPMQYQITDTDEKLCTTQRDGDFIFIKTNRTYKKGEKHYFTIAYSGQPKVAKKAPWDGGWVFAQDEGGNPFMSVAQEGIGTSVWLPVKDSWSDEPDEGMQMTIITPKNLVGVGNGRLTATAEKDGKMHYTWVVKNPINAYSIVPNVGKYVNLKDEYTGGKGKLDLDYWVLESNAAKAKTHFQQVKPMLKAMEYWFGPYPFYEDSYKLVESPYLGMEHQSSIAYGNGYQNGYRGRDLSGTGVGLNWDFIIIHESGHEWFANNITAKDRADMWVHESFTCYSETLFTENYMDKASADRYVQGIRKNILNDKPIIGHYGVGDEGSGDMYYKGANMLHTIRQVISNDEKFRQILRGLGQTFYHQTVTGRQVEQYITQTAGTDFSSLFDQYLRTTMIPTLELQHTAKTGQLRYRYKNVVKNFKLPLKLNSTRTILPNEQWQSIKLKNGETYNVDPNYYIKTEITEL